MSTAAASAHANAHQAETPVACPSCSTEIVHRYCSKCGEKRFEEHDLSVRHFLGHAFHEIVHLDSKIFRTLRVLFTRPGELTARYSHGAKTQYINPLRLFLASFALLIFLMSVSDPISIFNIRNVAQEPQALKAFDKLAAKKHITTDELFDRVGHRFHTYVSLSQPVQAGMMAFWLLIFFRRAARQAGVHLIHALHLLSFNCLFGVLLFPFRLFTGLQSAGAWALNGVTLILETTYLFVSARRVYGGPRRTLHDEAGLEKPAALFSNGEIVGRSIGVAILTFGGMVMIYGVSLVMAIVVSAVSKH